LFLRKTLGLFGSGGPLGKFPSRSERDVRPFQFTGFRPLSRRLIFGPLREPRGFPPFRVKGFNPYKGPPKKKPPQRPFYSRASFFLGGSFSFVAILTLGAAPSSGLFFKRPLVCIPPNWAPFFFGVFRGLSPFFPSPIWESSFGSCFPPFFFGAFLSGGLRLSPGLRCPL